MRKQTMSKAVSEEDLEKVQKAWGTVSAAVEKALAGIREEGVKEKLNALKFDAARLETTA